MEIVEGMGEFLAEIVSTEYKDLEGIKNNTYMENVITVNKWKAKKYFSYTIADSWLKDGNLKDRLMSMTNISDLIFDLDRGIFEVTDTMLQNILHLFLVMDHLNFGNYFEVSTIFR